MNINAIQDGLFWGCSRMGVTKEDTPSLKSITHILQWWNLVQLYLTRKRSKKCMNHLTHPKSPAEISNFSLEISKFGYIKQYMYRLHFDRKYLILLTFLEALKIVLIKKSQFRWCQQKWLAQAFLKELYFEKKGYDAIIYVMPILNRVKTLSMWQLET